MRMSDWSSDVCSSDLLAGDTAAGAANCAGIERLRQGDLVVRQAPAGSSAQLDGRPLQVSADGWYAFGIARDARKPITLEVHTPGAAHRSEEHTSELQSLMRISYAVFCLKKKNNKNKNQ